MAIGLFRVVVVILSVRLPQNTAMLVIFLNGPAAAGTYTIGQLLRERLAMPHVELQCSDQVVLQRLENTSRQAFGKLTDVALYQQIKQAGGFDFSIFSEPELVIDAAKSGASEAARQIIGELGLD